MVDIHSSLISQYGAGLAMLRSAIESCPDEHWDNDGYKNPFWHLAYHVLFYTHLYLGPSNDDYTPWEKERDYYQYMSDVIPWSPEVKVDLTERYTKADILEFHQFVMDELERSVHAVPLDAESGFYWLPFNRFELHVYNIRHLQHHTGQLVERIREETGNGVGWVGRTQVATTA